MIKEFPDIPSASTFSLYFPSFSFESSFTGVQQNAPMLGAHWKVKMSFPLKKGRDQMRLRAFVNGLNGRIGTVKIFDVTRQGRPAMGAPVVTGDNLKGKRLPTLGWVPGQIVLRAGDLFTVGNELKEIEDDIYSGVDGSAVLKFNPPIRNSPANSAPIITRNPYAVCRLAMDQVDIANQLGGFADFGELDFVEAIYGS